MSTRNQEDWIVEYEKRRALWIHNGHPRSPHAVLTSGKHSAGYFNSRIVTEDRLLLDVVATNLVERYTRSDGMLGMVGIVVGPQTGATKLAEAIASKIGRLRGRSCRWASPAKSEKDGQKFMAFLERQNPILPDDIVLLVEDVLTTGGSVALTAKACIDAGGTPLAQVLAIVNRSGKESLDGHLVNALITSPMPTWEAGKCSLCAGGSKPVSSPKDNWAELIAAVCD